MKPHSSLALIGAGPSALFTLQHALEKVELFSRQFRRILVFERQREAGAGMPYSRAQTSDLNLSNISSEELPQLPETFAAWLRRQSSPRLLAFGIEGQIRDDEIYPRVVLGEYFQAQFSRLINALAEHGVVVEYHAESEIADIRPKAPEGYEIVTSDGTRAEADAVVIATGHAWPQDQDQILFASPWPIQKLLPAEGAYHNFPIGLLGASLSAVDVINVLAHRHGSFEEREGRLIYAPAPGAEEFRLVMHSADGLLSHLQFEQIEPMREMNRHCSEEEIFALLDPKGHLRLSSYFDGVCRQALVTALREDGLNPEAEKVADPACSFLDFSEMMKEKHLSVDPFQKMKSEFEEARKKILRHRPTRWKEVLDDLMYTLNFHARLLPAEDHLELRGKILPFVMNVMAALPLKSAQVLMAVHDAGRLELIPGMAELAHEKGESLVTATVGEEDHKQIYRYSMFIDCAGQSAVDENEFPFRSLVKAGLVTPAVAILSKKEEDQIDPSKLRSTSTGERAMELGGMAVTDDYQLVSKSGEPVKGLYDIAVPHAAGLRPYCYGLQACNKAANILIAGLVRTVKASNDPEGGSFDRP